MHKNVARYKSKRHKYLSLLTIMLMMSSTFSGIIPGTQTTSVVEAKTTKKKSGGSKSYNYSGSWKRWLGKKAIITGGHDGTVVPGKDVKGYFVKNRSGIHGYAFGGTRSRWANVSLSKASKKRNGHLYVYYKRDADRGKVGAYYPHAYDFIDMKTMKRTPVDVKLTWMGNRNVNDKISNYSGHTNELVFLTQNVGVEAQGEGIDRFNVQLIPHGRMSGVYPLTFWDIDENQAIHFGNSTFSSISKFYYGGRSESGGSATWVKYNGKYKTFLGGKSGHWYGKSEATVKNNDAKGAFTAVTGSKNLTLDYGHNNVFGDPIGKAMHDTKKSSFASHATKSHTKRKPSKYVKLSSGKSTVGNLFEITPYPNIPPYKLTTEKLASKNYNGPWSKNLKLDNPSSFYYNVRTKFYWPVGAYGLKKGMNSLTISDHDIDPNLKVESAKVYYQRTPSDSMHRMSGFHVSISKKDGLTHVDAKATDSALKRTNYDSSKTIFNKIISLVIKVSPKETAYNSFKNGKLTGILHNKGYLTGGWWPMPNGHVLSGSGENTTTITHVEKPHIKEPGPGQIKKYVFKADSGKVVHGFRGYDRSFNWNKRAVVSGQHLLFKVSYRTPSTDGDHRVQNVSINDQLLDNLSMSDRDKKRAYINYDGHNYKPTSITSSSINWTKNGVEDSGGKLVTLYYTARVRPGITTKMNKIAHNKGVGKADIWEWHPGSAATKDSPGTPPWWGPDYTDTARVYTSDPILTNGNGTEPTKTAYSLGQGANENDADSLDILRHGEYVEYVISKKLGMLNDELSPLPFKVTKP